MPLHHSKNHLVIAWSFEIFLCGICMFFSMPLGFLWVLPQSKQMYIRLIGHSKLIIGVNVLAQDGPVTCPGFTLPHDV